MSFSRDDDGLFLYLAPPKPGMSDLTWPCEYYDGAVGFTVYFRTDQSHSRIVSIQLLQSSSLLSRGSVGALLQGKLSCELVFDRALDRLQLRFAPASRILSEVCCNEGGPLASVTLLLDEESRLAGFIIDRASSVLRAESIRWAQDHESVRM